MPNDCISYQDSGYFSKLVIDYLNEKPELKALYNRFPKIENFKSQIAEKQQHFPEKNREVLVAELKKQYNGFTVSIKSKANIESLLQPTTFTVTTGHQLNLFTGPLYFLYKIISTINLAKTLKKEFPDYNFVPVYWMATEDHDFEEINYFSFKGKKIKWNHDSSGPVGRLPLDGMQNVWEAFANGLGNSSNAIYLKQLFEKAYLGHSNLAAATRYLANELFGDDGLVILDGDSRELKKRFIPFAKEELLHQTSFSKVNEANKTLADYKIQVNPREINLFYIEDHLRERIVLEGETYKVNTTDTAFTKAEILAELDNHPEKFSPNVILRPLYQEVILPNLAYIGGGGEIAYWLELRSNFEANAVPFPMLILRNSVLLANEKQAEKADRLELSWRDLFTGRQELITAKTKAYSQFTLDFTEQKEHLKKQFDTLNALAAKTDPSFGGAVKAQQAKQIKGLENLEKRLLKAEKRNHADKIGRIVKLQDELFPNQSLQERTANFSEFYVEYGSGFLSKLSGKLQPLEQEFHVVVL